MYLILVRHAERETEKKAKHITANGKKQAIALANRLGKMKIDVMYCSKLARAKETMAFVRKKQKAPPLNAHPITASSPVYGKISVKRKKHKANMRANLNNLTLFVRGYFLHSTQNLSVLKNRGSIGIKNT